MITSWTLEQALGLIRELQPVMRDLHYHITLGGGVLNTGQSEKDLDLFFHPLNGYEKDSHTVLLSLMSMLGPYRAIRDSPDYGHTALFWYEEAVMFDYLGKRIDAFIM